MDAPTARFAFGIQIPATVKEQREFLITQDKCPECGGSLDTGWECNDCAFDALDEAAAAHRD